MKTKFLHPSILTLLLFISFASTAQENEYFNNQPIWKLTSSCSVGGFCVQNEVFNYYTNGDTLIDSIEYRQIYYKGQGSFTWNAGGSNMGCIGSYFNIDTVPKFFLRSLNKQMFVRFPGDTLEQLLYDFNLNVGDTLPLSYNNYFQEITVSAIDSISTAFGYRKRFTLAGSTWAQYIVEGIGHSRGLIEPLKVPANCTYILNCFSLNDSSYFPSLGASCNVAIGINQLSNEAPIHVYPNPFQTSTAFETGKYYPKAQLRLFTTLGEQVPINSRQRDGKLFLERAELSPGIYFYELSSEEQLIGNGKLVIVD